MKFGGFQSIKDKFAAKGEGKIAPLTLAAYGKLTLYKDYINLECNDGAAADYKRWMDQAFGMTFEEFGGRAVTLDYPSRVLMNLQGGKAFAVATLWPSTDEGGLRKFPFSFFAIIPKGTLAGKSVAEGLALLAPIWRAIDENYSEAKGLANIESFYGQFRGRKIESLPDTQDSTPFEFDAWMNSLVPSTGGAAEFSARLTGVVSNLISACNDLSEGAEVLAVRLPVAASLPITPQVAIWDRAFRENIKKCPAWPSLIFPAEASAENPTVCLIWRDLQKEDSRLFAPDITGYDKIEDVAGESRVASDAGAGEATMPPDLDSWIAQLGGR